MAIDMTNLFQNRLEKNKNNDRTERQNYMHDNKDIRILSEYKLVKKQDTEK